MISGKSENSKPKSVYYSFYLATIALLSTAFDHI